MALWMFLSSACLQTVLFRNYNSAVLISFNSLADFPSPIIINQPALISKIGCRLSSSPAPFSIGLPYRHAASTLKTLEKVIDEAAYRLNALNRAGLVLGVPDPAQGRLPVGSCVDPRQAAGHHHGALHWRAHGNPCSEAPGGKPPVQQAAAPQPAAARSTATTEAAANAGATTGAAAGNGNGS